MLTIKPTRCTNFSNLFLEWNSTCFGQFLCPSSGVFHCTHSNGICHTGLLTACKQDQDVPSWSCSQAVSKPVWHIPLLYVQWKTPDDGQRNCPKQVEFHSKNIFEKLVYLVGFIISIYHDARSRERQKNKTKALEHQSCNSAIDCGSCMHLGEILHTFHKMYKHREDSYNMSQQDALFSINLFQ